MHRPLAAAFAILFAAAPAAARYADVAAAVAAASRPAADRARDAGRKPAAILEFARVETGDAVLDWMAGDGYYSELLAVAVGAKGRVTAHNPPGFAAATAAVWAQRTARNPNIELLTGGFADVALPPASYDLMVAHLVYHDLYWTSAKYGLSRVEPRAVLRRIWRAMRPEATIIVVDHVGRPGDPRAEVERAHRIAPSTIKADFAEAGFVLLAESRALRDATDDGSRSVFDPSVQGRTDRVIYRFGKGRAPSGGEDASDPQP